MKEEEEVEVEFRNLKEFHRCKALENVNEHAFDGIIDNMAKVVQISPTSSFHKYFRCWKYQRTGRRN